MTRDANKKIKDKADAAENDELVQRWLDDDEDPETAIVETSRGPVHIRALTRDEVFASSSVKGGTKEQEASALAKAVTSPKMTKEQWLVAMRKRKSGDISDIMDRVIELSGMEEGANKAARAMFRDES